MTKLNPTELKAVYKDVYGFVLADWVSLEHRDAVKSRFRQWAKMSKYVSQLNYVRYSY